MAKEKTYVLLPSVHPSAPIYYLVGNKERVRLDKLPMARPVLRASIVTPEGKNRVLRLKLNSNSIYQDVQMKDEGIPANEEFTSAEYDAVKFRGGVLITTNEIVQEFLDEHPQNEAFKGASNDGTSPLFKLEDKEAEAANRNSGIRRMLKAVNKIMEETKEVEVAQEMLLRIMGSFYTPPTTLEDCQNELVNLIEENDEALDIVLKEDLNQDEEANLLVAKLHQAGIISFDAVPNQVVMKKGGKNINLKAVSSEYEVSERQRHLVEHITAPENKAVLDELKKEAEKLSKKKQVVETT